MAGGNVASKPSKPTTPAKPGNKPTANTPSGSIAQPRPATTKSPVGPESGYLKPSTPSTSTSEVKKEKKKKVVKEDTTTNTTPAGSPTVVNTIQNADGTTTIVFSDGTTRVIGTPTPKISAETKSAYATLTDTFTNYGLSGLSSVIQGFMQQGLSSSEAYLELIKTPEYKQRFAGNQGRLAKGVPVLREGDYIQAELDYADLLNQNSLYSLANQGTYAQLIGGNVSLAEAKDRINKVFTQIDNADPVLKEQIGNYLTGFGIGDPTLQRSQLASALLGGAQNADEMVRSLQKAQIKTAAVTANYNVAESDITKLQQQLETAQTFDVYGTSKKAFGELAQTGNNAAKLAAIYGADNTGLEEELQQQAFFSTDSQKYSKLKSKERAMFKGQAGTDLATFKVESAGQF